MDKKQALDYMLEQNNSPFFVSMIRPTYNKFVMLMKAKEKMIEHKINSQYDFVQGYYMNDLSICDISSPFYAWKKV